MLDDTIRKDRLDLVRPGARCVGFKLKSGEGVARVDRGLIETKAPR